MHRNSISRGRGRQADEIIANDGDCRYDLLNKD
jgi:hypothetical protein